MKETIINISANEEYILYPCPCGHEYKISVKALKEKREGQFICRKCKRIIQYTVQQSCPTEILYHFNAIKSDNIDDINDTEEIFL